MGIATMAFMVVVLLQLNSSRKHEQKEEQKKKDDASKNSGGGGGGGSRSEPQRLGLSNITAVTAPGQEEGLGGDLLATEGVSLG